MTFNTLDLDQLDPNKHYLFIGERTPVREISQDTAKQLKTDCRTAHEFIFVCRKQREVESNYKEYLNTYNKFQDVSEDIADIPIFMEEAYIEINRTFINFITSLIATIEQIEKKLTSLYHSEAKQTLCFKKKTKYWYDNYFSYRLFYQLRHYSAHYFVHPINNFKIDTTEKGREELMVSFSKSKLLRFDALKKAPLPLDLSQRAEEFPVHPLMEEISNVIAEILPAYLDAEKEKLDKTMVRILKSLTRQEATQEKIRFGTIEFFDENKKEGKFNLTNIPIYYCKKYFKLVGS